MTAKGAEFIRRHEGFVCHAYRDPAGIITIGTGFTNRSRVVKSWWIKTHGHPIRMGDTISVAQNDILLARAMDEEYGKGVGAALGPRATAHAKDAATSVSFNAGPKSLTWKWARLYRSGKIPSSANRLRKTAITARGRKLRGLVLRREAEARLLQFGDYGHGATRVSHGRPSTHPAKKSTQLLQDQKLLNSIGYDCGVPDGRWGRMTKAAVIRLQRDHGLEVDGILGPATRAKIIRLANLRRETAAGGVVGGGIAGTGATDVAADWMLYGGVAVLLIAAGWLAWFYRDEIKSFMKRI